MTQAPGTQKQTRKLKNWIQSYLEATENSEPPESYRRWVAISTIAAVLQRKCFLDWGLLRLYPNLYIVLVGPAGCRKGTAMSPAQKLLRSVGIPLAADVVTREALIVALKKANNSTQLEGGKVEIHSSLTVFSPELTVFIGYNKLDLISNLCDWFDCNDRFIYDTKNSGSYDITGVYLNLIGATTPLLLQNTLPPTTIGSGLTSRMIFIVEDKKGKVVARPFLTPAERKLWEDLEDDLRQMYLMHGEFKVKEEYYAAYEEWYTGVGQVPAFQSKHFENYMDRRATHLRKISMIINASRTDSMLLTVDDFIDALEILQEAEKKMPHTFGGMGRYSGSPVLYALKGFIRGKPELNAWEIYASFQSETSYVELNSMLESLCQSKFLTKRFDSQGVAHYVYNPKFDTDA